MKLYLDDIRNPHQSGYNNSDWIVCRNDKTFKDMFISFDNIVTHISLDHDIDIYDDNGVDEGLTVDVFVYFKELVKRGVIK